jgi:hypothetical protein
LAANSIQRRPAEGLMPAALDGRIAPGARQSWRPSCSCEATRNVADPE